MAMTTREMLADMRDRTGLSLSALGRTLGFSANAAHNWLREPDRRISPVSESLVRISYRCLRDGRWDLVKGGVTVTETLIDRVEDVLKATDDEIGASGVERSERMRVERLCAARDLLSKAREQLLLHDAELRRGQ